MVHCRFACLHHLLVYRIKKADFKILKNIFPRSDNEVGFVSSSVMHRFLLVIVLQRSPSEMLVHLSIFDNDGYSFVCRDLILAMTIDSVCT